jgi:hypothetical protein
MPSPSALHSKKTPKWGSPSLIVEPARELLDGQIMLDPASSPEFNEIVKALMIYTEHDNGLILPWAGNVFINPPGGLVKEFWERLIQFVQSGEVEKAVWIGFSVEQLCLLADQEWHPLDFSTCILRKRLAFTQEDGTSGGSPSHGNYVTGLGVDRATFDKLFNHLGHITHGSLAV